MSLKDQLKEDMKAAMKAREEGKTALSVIRMVNSAIKNTEINVNPNPILPILLFLLTRAKIKEIIVKNIVVLTKPNPYIILS